MSPGMVIILSMWIPATVVIISLIKYLGKEEARIEERRKRIEWQRTQE